MEFLKEIIIKSLSAVDCKVTCNIEENSLMQLLQDKCFHTLSAIKRLLENSRLSDFEVVEAIVSLFESLGSSVIARHDF